MQKRSSLAAAVFAATVVVAGAGTAAATSGAHADGEAKNSPGIASGNLVQAPVDVPVNACGNTVSAVGVLNPTDSNSCENL